MCTFNFSAFLNIVNIIEKLKSCTITLGKFIIFLSHLNSIIGNLCTNQYFNNDPNRQSKFTQYVSIVYTALGFV